MALSRTATGPSYAIIKIIPLALSRQGLLLCKTFYVVNRTGAHSLQRAEFGWLVVSARGVWEETSHMVVDPDELPYEQAERRINFYNAEFERSFNWASPPLSVRPILARYGFHHRGRFNPQAGAGTLALTSTQLCAQSRCATREVVQRSLHNLRSEHRERSGEGASVRVSFHSAGIALFRNVREEETARGADFFIPTLSAAQRAEDSGVDYWTIDAILFTRGAVRSDFRINGGSSRRSRARN